MPQQDPKEFAQKLAAVISQELDSMLNAATSTADQITQVLEVLRTMQKRNEEFQKQISDELQHVESAMSAKFAVVENRVRSLGEKADSPYR